MDEVWKEIKGFEGKYYISNTGYLKSINGKYKLKFPDGYITNGCTDSTGYKCVTLRKPGILYKVRVHSLVGEYFVHKKESTKRLVINHKDGNKLNNHEGNLEWVTDYENVRHAVDTGLMNFKGENHHYAKLTKEKVIEMRRLRNEDKLTHEEIAKRFGVCRRQAGDVINGVNWGWL